jgi:tRNA threonylcarbamoyladenosine biosynthesis protein TsaB
LLENERVCASVEHEAPSAHSERLLPLLEELLASAGWSARSLDRIAVGTGPGSFVGLRVGIALAEGLSLGLGRPVAGVCSLAAMARAVASDVPGVRAALLDARQNEVFVYACDEQGLTCIEPFACARGDVEQVLKRVGTALVVGEIARELALDIPHSSGPDLDLPHARGVASGARLEFSGESKPVLPLYVRGPGATRPNLPPSPFAEPR